MGRKRKLENRDMILKASYRLFISRGYDNVSAQEIEKESGINTRSFYRYFRNKDEILGAIIESVEKKMMEYLEPVLTEDRLLTFVLFSVMKQEFALYNHDYFRMRASLIERPDAFIKSFMELYALSYPQMPDWKSDENTMRQGLYILGGTLIVQYGFMKNLTGEFLSGEIDDFMRNYDKRELSEQAVETYRRFMDYAICNNLHILGLPDENIQEMIEKAYSIIDKINISGFRRYYEDELGFCQSTHLMS